MKSRSLAEITPEGPNNLPKSQQVRQMFDRLAPSYDRLNDCISMGMHRLWKRQACRLLQLKPGDQALDVCTGTGDLVTYLLNQVGPTGQVVGVDFSEEMLKLARKRFSGTHQALFQQGDATALPYEDNRFDGAIVSFGLRNVTDIPKAVAEMARVVKPGGWVVNLDTAPTPKLPGYWFYFSKIMPWMGRLFSKDARATADYRYLSESTKHFLQPEELTRLFQQAGLVNVSTKTMSMGAVSIQVGQKHA